MSKLALACAYEGNYAVMVVNVDTENTMEEVAQIAKEHIAGTFVPEPKPGVKLRVRRHGEEEFLPEDLKVSDAGFIQLETVDVIHVPVA